MEQKMQTILIVDDSKLNRTVLAQMLGDEYRILEAEDGGQAIALLQKYSAEVSLILLDLIMPKVDGFEVLTFMSQRHWIDYIPVVMISAESVPSFVERAYDLGATDYISRPFNAGTVRRRVLNTLMLYAKQRRLTAMVADQVYEKEKTSSLMVEILSNIVEFRNGESGLHVLHIRVLTELLLKRVLQVTDRYHIALSSVSLISKASALHDIGKIAIPTSILNKPGPLTPLEYEVMKSHTIEGAAILERLPLRQHEPLVRVAYEICRWHHERYDGSGYPDGLAGDSIPISAQIVALADVYDALTSQRAYKPPLAHEKAIEMILSGQCGAFDPLLLQCLADVAPELPLTLQAQLSQRGDIDLLNVTENLGPYSDPVAERRTADLLEHELLKYQFFASMTREIQFELSVVPHLLILSEWGARRLELDEIITSPTTSEALFQVISREDVRILSDMVYATTTDAPIVEYRCPVRIGGQFKPARLILRSMWSTGDPPAYTGAIGKLMEDCGEPDRDTALAELSTQDMLTGLLSRAQAEKHIDALLADPEHLSYALALLDLDHLETVNEHNGHLFGDNMLKLVADRLRRSIRGSDLAARVEGDEFLLFMAYTGDPRPQVERVFSSLPGAQDRLHISASMGVALCPAGQRGDLPLLLQCAQQAMGRVKAAGGGGYRFFGLPEPPAPGQM